MTQNQLRHMRRGLLAAAFTAAALTAALAPLSAQAVITDTDWSLKISEREKAFRPATDMAAMKALMWELPSSRMFARNLPFICLTNESDSASISQFKMTIGDEQFHFANSLMGMYAKVGKENNDFSISSGVEDDGNTLVVNFLNGGLAPGKTINFQFDIDVDAGLPFFVNPDYRTVLFDINGDNYYRTAGIINDPSSDDNATVQLTFTQSGMPSVTTMPVAFPDPSILDGSAGFVNSNMARYSQNDPIRTFALEGGAIIPEPSSGVLCALGLAAAAVRPRGRRNSGNPFHN